MSRIGKKAVAIPSGVNVTIDGQKLFDVFTHARGIRREIIDAGQDTAAPNFGRGEGEKK